MGFYGGIIEETIGVQRYRTLLCQGEGDQLPHHQQMMLAVGYL